MKTIRIKSAIPLYASALIWLLFGLFSPIYDWRYTAFAAGASIAVYMLTSVFFPGRKLEVEEKPNSGDGEVDRQIEQARARLKSLHEVNDAIEDETISARLDRMTDAGGKILECLEKDVRRASIVRRFMGYYLPTAEKLLGSYRALMQSGSKGGNVSAAMVSIENSLEMIAQAFEKQLDGLYRDEALDIQTDIDALEAVLAGEGLAGPVLKSESKQETLGGK